MSRKVWLWLVCAMVFFATVRAEDSGESIYQQGMAVYESNPAAAYGFFLEAAGKGHVQSMVAMGHCCETGSGIATNWSAAAGWYGMAMKKDPVKTCQGLGAINALARGIRKGDAAKRLDFFKANNSSASQVYETALRLLAEGRSLDASDLLDRSVTKFPDDQRLLFMRGVLWRSRFAKLHAFIHFYCVQLLHASTPLGLAADAAFKMDQGKDVAKGFRTLRSLIRKQPDNLLLRWLFAIQCREHNRYHADAAKAYEYILERWDPAPVMVYQTYANILTERLSRPEDALPYRRKALELEKASWTYQGLANTLFELKRYEEAEPAYAKATELDPSDSRHWWQWGDCLQKLERTSAAADCFRRALEIDPSDLGTMTDLANCLIEQEKYEEAVDYYRKILEINPEYSRALMGLSNAYQHGYGVEKDEEKATTLMKRSFGKITGPNGKTIQIKERNFADFDETTARGCESLGRAYQFGSNGAENDYAKAVNYYKKAIEMGLPGNAYNLGLIYIDGGSGVARNIPVALEWYEWLAEKDPKELGLGYMMRSLAMSGIVSTCGGFYGDEYIDGPKGVAYALQLVREESDSIHKKVLAKAYAMNGQFEEAIALLESMAAFAEENGRLKELAEIKELLERYRAGKLHFIERAKNMDESEVVTSSLAPLHPADLKTMELPVISRPSASSQYLLEAKKYQYGQGVEKNGKKALELFKQAYEKGKDGLAAYHVALMYRRGHADIPVDYSKAIEWHKKAIERGFTLSHDSIISLYLSPAHPELWDVERALQHAQILEKERSFDSACLASAAKAYAQSGQFDKAVALQRKAVEQYKFGRVSAKRLALLEKYLACYERGEKPYSEPGKSRR